jgi:D-alanine transaminase
MQSLPSTLCYLNGEYTPLCDAKVSVLDRGFIFGDGIYDVAPVYAGKLFRFEEHLDRLSRSLGKLRITNPLTREEWLERCRRLVEIAQGGAGASANHVIYIQVTRGVAMRDHVMPSNITPTVFMMINPMTLLSAEQRHKGVSCVTARDFRWERADIKSTSLLGNVMARQISADQGLTETVMFRNGYLTEASLSKRALCSGRPKMSMCSKAYVLSCCASCVLKSALPTTCARSHRLRFTTQTSSCSARPVKKSFPSPC